MQRNRLTRNNEVVHYDFEREECKELLAARCLTLEFVLIVANHDRHLRVEVYSQLSQTYLEPGAKEDP